MASMAFEVLGLLVLDEDLLILKLSFTVVTPHLRGLFLLLTHLGSSGASTLALSRSNSVGR